MTTRVLAFGCLVLFAACSESKAAKSIKTVADLEAAVTDTACDALLSDLECYADDAFGPQLATREKCVELVAANIAHSELIAAAARGGVTFTASAAKACVDAFRVAVNDCSFDGRLQLEELPECRAAFVPMSPHDGVCTSSVDCPAADYCEKGPNYEPACRAGQCQTRKAVGDACTPTADSCAIGFVCSYNADDEEYQCEVDPQSVEPTIAGLDESCQGDNVRCGAGLYCDYFSTMQCKAYLVAGAVCSSDACAPGFECWGRACVPVRYETEAGAPCTDEATIDGPPAEFVYCSPFYGLYCDGRRCAARAEGECSTGFAAGGCSESEHCFFDEEGDSEFGDCRQKAAEGEECFEHDECLSGRCDLEAYTCTAC